jgi:hypothetical protein
MIVEMGDAREKCSKLQILPSELVCHKCGPSTDFLVSESLTV